MKRKIVEIDEEKCNGCGECIPNCVEGALKIINGKARLVKDTYCDGLGACLGHCPQDAINIIEREADEFNEQAVHEYLKTQETTPTPDTTTTSQQSTLNQWPVQLNLVPIKAPMWDKADLLLVADCVAVAYANLHNDLIKDRKIVMGCPKFDNGQHYVEKLTAILQQNNIRSLTIAVMEVPCCRGLNRIAELALKASGKMIPTQILTIKIDGEIVRS